jgi:hypothetical protein
MHVRPLRLRLGDKIQRRGEDKVIIPAILSFCAGRCANRVNPGALGRVNG